MVGKTYIETLRGADWDQVERDVVDKIRFLKAASMNLESNSLNDRIAKDLILPSLKLLGQFCINITIDA